MNTEHLISKWEREVQHMEKRDRSRFAKDSGTLEKGIIKSTLKAIYEVLDFIMDIF